MQTPTEELEAKKRKERKKFGSVKSLGKAQLTKDSPLLSRREKFVTSELTKVALGVLISWLSIPRTLVCRRPMSSILPLILSHSMRSPTLKNGLKNKRLMPPIRFFASCGHARATKKKNASARPVSWMRSQFLTSWEAKPKAI